MSSWLAIGNVLALVDSDLCHPDACVDLDSTRKTRRFVVFPSVGRDLIGLVTVED